ncbi:DNA repair protein [Moumouvirus goulette]|uniref:DNA repair protein n=1 Tax=Moumouvirus goulette TaxID=1247379 RepID=M1PWK6_9VIRU|nr:DNA repair protein [Moumouvirus goulette]AGF85137.1 DNA repair protein [Moumouvirus goulette]
MATKKSGIDIIESDTNSETSSEKSNNSELSESSDKSITYIKLEDDGKKEIENVYHISDIHIRNTQRHQEYRDVFEKTYCKLKSSIGNNKDCSLIVLTGDIMHTKTELSPEAISIAYHFFKCLNEIAPVILIPGNHDCNLSNKNRLDALSPIVEDVGKLQNLYYLKKSGIYQYQNIVFGVTSVFDDVLVSAKKINTEMWNKIKQKKKYKIALYHGPVHNAKTDVGFRMNNEQLLAEDFDGYDYVMLGDIHKFQFMNEQKTIAYSGSLIQQSYGETLNKHGVLKWNLSEQKTEFLEIKNDFGFCTVKIIDGQMIETEIPKKPRIRFILENTNQLQYQEIVNNLEKKYLIQEIVKESNFKTKMHNDSPSQKTIKKETSAYNTQEIIIKKYLEKKQLDKISINNTIELHKKIYQKILSQKKDQVADVMHNAIKNQKWKLLELKFSNTLSYGKDNVIDFRKYDTNKIIGIVAPNHYGKSAILDIILFCLFDKCSRGERRDILNKNENSMHCSLLFSVGSQEYLIERLGYRNKNGLTVKIDVNFYLLEKDKHGKIIKKNLNGIDKNDTNKKISEIIGDYNDYLTTCFCLQQGKSLNFTDMTQLQKKEYLNDILKLNVFEDCYNYARDKLKELAGKLKILEQKVGQKSLEEIKDNVKNLCEEIKKLEFDKNHIENNLISLIQLSIDKHNKPSLITYNELSHYNFKTLEEIVNAQDNMREIIDKKLDIDINQINKNLTETQEKLKKLKTE